MFVSASLPMTIGPIPHPLNNAVKSPAKVLNRVQPGLGPLSIGPHRSRIVCVYGVHAIAEKYHMIKLYY